MTLMDGQKLGVWVKWQRNLKDRNKLPLNLVERLEEIGFPWNGSEALEFERKFALLQKYIHNKGKLEDVDDKLECDGENIGEWTQTQQGLYNLCCRGDTRHMSKERFDRLAALGFQDTSKMNAPVNNGGKSVSPDPLDAATADQLSGQTDEKENATIVYAPSIHQLRSGHATAPASATSAVVSAQDPHRAMAKVVLQVESIDGDDAGKVHLHNVAVHKDWKCVARVSYGIQRRVKGGLPDNGFKLPVLKLPGEAVNVVPQVVRYINDSSYTPAFETRGAPWLWLVSEALEIPQLKTDILAFLLTVSRRATKADFLDLEVCLDVATKEGLNVFVDFCEERFKHCAEEIMHETKSFVSRGLKRAHEEPDADWWGPPNRKHPAT